MPEPIRSRTLDLVETVTPLIAEKLAVCESIPTGAKLNATIDHYLDHRCERMVFTLMTYLTKAAHPKPRVHSFYHPENWWQMFKRDYLPQFLLDRFPVRMDRTDFHYDSGTFLCPHMDIPWTERQHVDFITLQENPIEAHRMRGEELCGELFDRPFH